jgi:hypothetical protein
MRGLGYDQASTEEWVNPPPEYTMVQKLDIDNFRCFRNVRLAGLTRVNILTGGNASGKTALLEALFLAIGGGSELALRIRQWRGLPADLQVTSISFPQLWRDLFYHFDSSTPILLALVDSEFGSRSLEITYTTSGTYLLPLGGESHPQRTGTLPLTFLYRIRDREPQAIVAELTEQGISLGSIRDPIPGVYISPGIAHSPTSVTRFSDLSKVNREKEVVRALHEEFPEIESLSVEVHFGKSVLYASVSSVPEEKMPVELVSSGISKFLAILLAIAATPKGVVIVDEIENGFHYSHLPSVWKTILDFCSRFDVQMFASTHSMEFLRAAVIELEAHEDQICLLRARKTDGACEVDQVLGHRLEAAVAEGFEVR